MARTTVNSADGSFFTSPSRLYKCSNGALHQYFPNHFNISFLHVQLEFCRINGMSVKEVSDRRHRLVLATRHSHLQNQTYYFSKTEKVKLSAENVACIT